MFRFQSASLLLAVSLLQGATFGSNGAPLPVSSQVETQPLRSQLIRLTDAMAYLGNPLSTTTAARIRQATSASALQAAIDKRCIATVSISDDGSLQLSNAGSEIELQEQGWVTHLVKILNPQGIVGSLRFESPTAGPLPNASADQINARWLDLHPYNSRPLKPQLSGLEVEYRILQIYSRDAGRRSARLNFSFSMSSRPDSGVIREWNFESDHNHWRALRHIGLDTRNYSLHGHMSGRDPSMAHPIKAPAGRMVLRFSAKSSVGSFGQIFWSTKDKPRFDGNRRINFMLERNGGQWKDYAIPFSVTNDLKAIRIDPGSKAGHVEFDWIQLGYADSKQGDPTSAVFSFNARPSNSVRFDVRDENGKPATASFVIEDEKGRIYPATAKRLAPDFFFHTHVYRHHGEAIRLPDGKYQIRCSRGPETTPEIKTLVIAGKPATFRYQVKRWVDPAASGWYSGDHHIHAAGCKHYTNPTEGVLAEHMARHIQGEDLKIGANLTWGPGFDYQKQFFAGKIDAASKYPYLLRYDIEVSGFGSHRSGHLCLLRLRNQMYPGGDSKDHWPTLGLNTLKWAKAQGAITGPAHSAIGLRPTQERVPGKDGPDGLPNHFIPDYTGIGANEYIVDITHQVRGPDGKPVPAVDFISTMDTDRTMELNMWYHTLNSGFRVRASGETDFPCLSGERVGKGRVYVEVDGELTYDKWCEGIQQGRSYVSDGLSHIMDFAGTSGEAVVRPGENDGELSLKSPARMRFLARVATRTDGPDKLPVELIVNSYPVATKLVQNDGTEQQVRFEVDIPRSSWVALRIFPSAHTNPLFVIVDGKPIRSRQSARWFLKGIDNLWKQKQWTYAETEQADAKAA